MKFILARKLNMSQRFTEDGMKIPVTALEAGPCKVLQVKNLEKDKYAAVQIGFGQKKHLNKPASGHQKNEKYSFSREFRIGSDDKFEAGQEITVKTFEPGEVVDVSGIMKGRGFAGPVKRHGFHGAPASHGHNHPRAVGSIGSRFPQHTLKGTRMAGRMGGRQVTVKNLLVVDIDADHNLLFVKGAVPGTRMGLVKIRSTGHKEASPKLFTNAAKVKDPVQVEAKTDDSSNAQ